MASQINSASNQKRRARECYKEYDKLDYDPMETWRGPARTWSGLQTCPNCRIYGEESADKSNSESILSPVRNPGAARIKTDAQVAYGVQFGRSWTHWKAKEIIFPMGPVPNPNSFGVDGNHRNNVGPESVEPGLRAI